jgi:hypothetical protein
MYFRETSNTNYPPKVCLSSDDSVGQELKNFYVTRRLGSVSLPMAHTLSQKKPVHTLACYSLKSTLITFPHQRMGKKLVSLSSLPTKIFTILLNFFILGKCGPT